MLINKIRTTENIDTIKHINYNKLRTSANSINWSELSLINDPNSALNNLIDKIKMCICKAEYKIKSNKNKSMRPTKNWITKAIMKSCTTKEKRYKIWNKDPYNNRKREEYKNFTNILKSIINKPKELYDN